MGVWYTKIGYARVSTERQNLDRQRDNLKAAGCERIYEEKASGKTRDRPELNRVLDVLRKDDVLVVDSIDRLSRSMKDLLDIESELSNMNVGLISLTENIDTTNPEGKMLLAMFATHAQIEHNMISERTKDGLKAARARGRMGGRPKKGTEKDKIAALALYDANVLTNKEIAQRFKVSPTTFSRWIAERKHKLEAQNS